MNSQVLFSLASAAEHPLIDLDSTAFVQFAIFAVTALVASRLLFGPYLRMREERDRGIQGARREAEAMSAEADARLAEYEATLAAARSRATDERRTIRAEAAESTRDLTEGARREAARALEDARTEVATATTAARATLLPQADRLATQMASQLLGRAVS